MLKTSKSKNDPTARGPAQQAKSFEGKKIKPVLYVGTAVGHGRYIAAQDESGKMILDRGGKPAPYRADLGRSTPAARDAGPSRGRAEPMTRPAHRRSD